MNLEELKNSAKTMKHLVLITLLAICSNSFSQVSIEEKHRYLASLFYQGQEAIEKGDYSKAFSFFTKAYSEGDSINSPLELGDMSFDGNGCPKNLVKAFSWWEIAAKNGNASAMCRIAGGYFEGDCCQKDLPKALYWYKKAGDNGDFFGYGRYASMLLNGEGCEVNTDEATRYFKLAADNGDDYSQYVVGLMYYYGDYGFAKNNFLALSYLKKSAAQGYIRAAAAIVDLNLENKK